MVAVACAVLLIVVFAVSAGSKLRGRSAYAEFAATIPRFAVPRRLVRPAGVLVVAAECLIPPALAGSLLTGNWLAMAGFMAAAVLLAAFTAGIVIARKRGSTAPCRCFGVSSVPLGTSHIARNLVLLAAAVVGGVSMMLGAPLYPTALLPGLVLGGFAAALVLAAETLADVRSALSSTRT